MISAPSPIDAGRSGLGPDRAEGALSDRRGVAPPMSGGRGRQPRGGLSLPLPLWTVEARWTGGEWHPVGAVGDAVQRMTEADAEAWASRLRAMWAGRAEVRVSNIGRRA